MSESENPKVVSEERKHYLIKKWGAILEYDKLSDDEYFEKFGKRKNDLKTAYILEGQESWISPEAKKKYELGNKIY